jgi:hypothetical protein
MDEFGCCHAKQQDEPCKEIGQFHNDQSPVLGPHCVRDRVKAV